MPETVPETEHREPETPPRAKTIVVMPALNAAKTLEFTVGLIPQDVVDEIILVDDRSTDETLEIARRLGVSVIWHPHNVGYGGNQKTCYLEALQRDADIVVMLHPDGQYEPELIPKLDRADPGGKRRPGAWLAHDGGRGGEGGRNAALQATRQPRSHPCRKWRAQDRA